MDDRARSPLRMLAPVALAVFGVLFLILLFSGGGGEEEGDDTVGSSQQATGDGGSSDGSGAKSYTVEAGDTLDGIAEKTGVTIEEIQQLNPDLDPQALTAGQKVKLRE
jgi:hypothetical protein